MSIIIFYTWNFPADDFAPFDWRPLGAPLPAGAVPCAVVVDGLVVWRDVPRCQPWQWAQYVGIVRRATAR